MCAISVPRACGPLLEAIDFHPLDLIEHGLLEGPRVLSSNAPDLVGTQERNELQGAHQGDRDRLRVGAHRRLGDELAQLTAGIVVP
jgi:hypothetical protein